MPAHSLLVLHVPKAGDFPLALSGGLGDCGIAMGAERVDSTTACCMEIGTLRRGMCSGTN